MCVGQWHGRHGREPGRTGVYAAQHTAGRECVPGGSTTGRHVPTPRDGKKHSQCSVLCVTQEEKPFWFNSFVYFFKNRTVST